MPAPELDPRTPVLVGVGQSSDRLDGPDHRWLSPVELAAEAARAAFVDSGADPVAVAAAVDVLAAVRQFEVSTPVSQAPFGRSDNVPRSIAARIGADPVRAVLEVAGGQSPQHLVTELSRVIAGGTADVVLIASGEAISTVRALRDAAEKPDWSEEVGGQLEDRGYGLAGLASRYQLAHGLSDAPSQYALCETARRARTGMTREEYALDMGRLFAPFTEVAAANPHSGSPVARTAEELATPSEDNRLIADPYTRLLVARDQVNQGAAVLLMSVAAAERLGVAQDRWVFLHGHADLRERDLLERADLSRSPAAVLAVEHALEVAGIGTDDLRFLDLYSCFPIAVSNVCDGLGLAPEDPRGLTLTGGLPYFGGAGNGYSLHAVAEVVDRVRAEPGAYGLVGANGGLLSKYSAGVYSTVPTTWREDRSDEVQRVIDGWDAPPLARHADGWAVVETCTVKHGRAGRTGIVLARLEADGRRFLATTLPEDDEVLALLETGEPVGARVFVRATGPGNRVTTTRARMDVLLPARPPGLREAYEHVRVRRDGHVLEVTIDRPDARNALHPPANAELDEVFDAFFADADLRVAILAGAGEQAFSAGNDLAWTATGQQVWVPANGFAGITSRRSMPKPVIAAVNGYALGGGFEIALACHLVVADETAQFGLPEVQVGLVAAAGGVVRLPRSVPEKVAHELVLTGRRVSAAEAQSLGLVNRVVPAGTALDGARALAAELLQGSPTSLRASLLLMEGARAEVVDTVEAGEPVVDDLLVSEDAVEGVTSFVQRRPPVWKGR